MTRQRPGNRSREALHRPSRTSVPRARAVRSLHPEELPVTVGSVILGRRVSAVNSHLRAIGEPATHCAIVDTVPGRPGEFRTIELGPDGVFFRSIADFVVAYDRTAVLEPKISRECRGVVVDAARTATTEYSWTFCSLIELSGLSRRFGPGSADHALVRRTIGFARALRAQHGDGVETCSGFVAACLATACSSCRPVLQWPARRLPPRRQAARGLGELFEPDRHVAATEDESVARVLVTPGDLWVSVPARRRLVREGDGSITDLVGPRCRAAEVQRCERRDR